MSDTQETATSTEKRGWVGTVFAMAGVFILAVLLVFPGFLAALFSRTDCDVYLVDGAWWYHGPYDHNQTWDLGPKPFVESLRRMRATEIVLYPAATLMEYSSALRWFYTWQYQHAGGKVITGPILVL